MKETRQDCVPPRRRVAGRQVRWAAAIAVMFAPSALVAQHRTELEARIQRQVLPNGLEVMVIENRGVPLVTIEAIVRNGSFTEDPEFDGLAHLYEHMIFKANATHRGPDEFVSRASELGAVFNGTTAEEQVTYYLTVPSDNAAPAMRLLAAALTGPLFRRDELERERAVVIGEYDRNESNPFFGFMTDVGKALWTTAWSRKNPLGERNVIRSATPDKLREIQRRYYVPNNTAIIIAGDIDTQRGFDLARAAFGSWTRGADPFVEHPVPPIPPLRRDTVVISEQPIGDAAIVMLQWHGPSARQDLAATYAADVFSDMLNQPGSRFQERLVESGLFQSVNVHYYTLNHVGPITIMGETTQDKLEAALAALRAELPKVLEPDYFSAEHFDVSKQKRIVGSMLSLERSSRFADQLGFWWAVTGLDYFYGYVDTMAQQTPADLRRYAATYIVGKPHVTGVLLSPEARRGLKLTAARLLPAETAR
jgi:zinc protease